MRFVDLNLDCLDTLLAYRGFCILISFFTLTLKLNIKCSNRRGNFIIYEFEVYIVRYRQNNSLLLFML